MLFNNSHHNIHLIHTGVWFLIKNVNPVLPWPLALIQDSDLHSHPEDFGLPLSSEPKFSKRAKEKVYKGTEGPVPVITSGLEKKVCWCLLSEIQRNYIYLSVTTRCPRLRHRPDVSPGNGAETTRNALSRSCHFISWPVEKQWHEPWRGLGVGPRY